MIIIGIDPGKKGAVAALSLKGDLVYLADTPTLKVGKRHEYDLAGMAQVLQGFPEDTLVAVEQLGAMPLKGSIGAFSLGQGCGLWLGMAAMRKMPIARITPQLWQRALLAGLPKGKGSSLVRARELFPGAASMLTRKRDDGPADALLIAEFARRQFGVPRQSSDGGSAQVA